MYLCCSEKQLESEIKLMNLIISILRELLNLHDQSLIMVFYIKMNIQTNAADESNYAER